MLRTFSKITTFALIVLIQTSCDKETVVLDPIPTPDPSNGVCVVSQELTPYFGDTLGAACNEVPYLPESRIISEMNAMANALDWGTGGTRYKVLGRGWRKSAWESCGGHSSYITKADIWAKYECQGVAIDVKIYGPYPSSTLSVKTTQHTNELKAQGYQIAYVSQDQVSNNSSIYFLSFFVYKEDASNANQAAVVSALKHARTFNRATTLSADRPLSDTLERATQVIPGLENNKAMAQARDLVETLDRIRNRN